jgi:hypothetical protein
MQRKQSKKKRRRAKADYVDGMVVLSKNGKLVALMSLNTYKAIKEMKK